MQTLSQKNHYQTPVTCTYGYSHFIHFKTVATEVEIYFLSTWISLLPQFGSAFSLLKKGVSQYFCPYNECTSNWCLVMNFWLKVQDYKCLNVTFDQFNGCWTKVLIPYWPQTICICQHRQTTDKGADYWCTTCEMYCVQWWVKQISLQFINTEHFLNCFADYCTSVL